MKVSIEGLSKAERRHILSQFSLVELFQELHRRAEEDEEEELEEVGKKEFEFRNFEEVERAFGLLGSRYPFEVVKLIFSGFIVLPGWLQREILERRERKDD